MNDFYKKYISLCAKINKSPSAVAEAVGLSRTSPNGWKKGNKPKDTTIEKLSSYFGISSSFFADEPDQSTSDKKHLATSPKNEQSFMELYRQMTEEEKNMAEIMLKSIIEARK